MLIMIERFEEDRAVVEIGEDRMLIVPRELFPGAEEGDKVEIRVLGKTVGVGETRDVFDRLREKSHKSDSETRKD